MSHIHWVTRQNKLEIPNDEEEVNTREIHKCDGQAHDPDTMVTPLTPKPTPGRLVPFVCLFASSAATVSPDAPKVLEAMVQLEQARTRAKAANKLTLDVEKEKDVTEQEVQRLQQLLQSKRTRTHDTTDNDHEECDKKSSDDMDLADHCRGATRIQNRLWDGFRTGVLETVPLLSKSL
jgi:hypothetical protein